VIAITVPQFAIGRDPECNLRPASPIISKRHCALMIRGGEVVVHDFDSTNGTFVNSEQVKGDRMLQNEDRLTVGPLIFKVQLEASTAVDKPTPVPPTRTAARSEEDEAAAALLLSADEGGPLPGSEAVDSQGVPTGNTVMETVSIPPPEEANGQDKAGGGAERERAAKAASADTSTAAKAILEKYLRRPRT
jgi:pSer/pThr/pTyr-binding forkhead associated (FHA) protein